MFWSTFISLQHLFMFKYQFDTEKYVKFLIIMHKTKLFDIGLPVERSIYFFKHGKAFIWPICICICIVGSGRRKGGGHPFCQCRRMCVQRARGPWGDLSVEIFATYSL